MENDIFTNNDMIQLQSLLNKNNQTITTAESCTGGLIASMITNIEGSSSIFNGAIVTYSNKIKIQELNVQKQTIDKYDVVSIEVVNEMLEGVIKKFDATFAIAVSGVAGPRQGSNIHPVGTVAIGIKEKNRQPITELFHFKGNRNQVQNQTAKMALKLIFEICKQKA